MPQIDRIALLTPDWYGSVMNETPLKIGDWRVDPAIDEIFRAGSTLKLEPRTMRVLVCLATNAGEVVSVEQLMDAVWKDVVVTPDSVYQAVAALRRALGDDPKEPRYIANVVRRGYRLIAAVAPWREGAGAATPPIALIENHAGSPVPVVRGRGMLWGAGLLVLVGATATLWFLNRPPAASRMVESVPVRERSIAVLPFADMSEGQNQEYFAAGMAEEILDTLARIPQLKVIARTSSFQFKGRSEDLRNIGAKLGAAYIVQGSVRKSGNRIRVTAQLVDVTSATNLWSSSYEREYGDVLEVQDQIAASIGRALQLVVVSDDSRPTRQLLSTEAYTFYLRGLSALDRGDESGSREAVSDLNQALALDAGFARAAETLALAHISLLGNAIVPSEAGWPEAAKAAKRALELDPDSALAHGILGLMHATYDFDWQAAESELDRALAVNPRDAVALYINSWLAFDLGRHEEAVTLGEASLSIDPLNPDAWQNSAYIYYLIGNLDVAERDARRSMAISPSFTGNHKLLGQILLQRGQPEAALVEMQAELSGSRDVGLALAYHALGRKAESDAALLRAVRLLGERLQIDIAAIYAYRGERDLAFLWLTKSVGMREISLGHKFRDEPKFASLRDDPRYKALLRRMNLPDS